ncbi:phospholipase [Listeria seeligeri]|uniref:phospholipase n=1 Tax=Listeria seeligeri TaxID=1640 RepID=UPI001626D656|nr:phospholipase [Listeria seeligeri]MBC1757183.1 phospholipase [Listeria seeligeri]MBC1816689.1 phospholipase [Listeria seeligeri]MBC2031250.1 phospholipase [Listeria seeligeri]MBC6115660.1 phospholipase [Listeria seeligeri]MBC6161468.1 phospholipase [Listeria seeligeri]
MEIKGVLMGLCLSASIVTLPVVSEVSACGEEGAKDQAAFHVQNKLPSKKDLSAEQSVKTENNLDLWLFEQATKIIGNYDGCAIDSFVEEMEKYKKEITQGIYDAAHNKNAFAVGFCDTNGVGYMYNITSYISHFYDPDGLNAHLREVPHAKNLGEKYWNISVGDHMRENFKEAYYKLGLAIHYFTDVSQPMRANNFTALSDPEGYQTAYENYVNSIKHLYPATKESKPVNVGFREKGFQKMAKRAKADFPKIVNDRTKEFYTLGLSDDEKARTWKEEVKDVTGERLKDAEERLAGSLVTWWVETLQ